MRDETIKEEGKVALICPSIIKETKKGLKQVKIKGCRSPATAKKRVHLISKNEDAQPKEKVEDEKKRKIG